MITNQHKWPMKKAAFLDLRTRVAVLTNMPIDELRCTYRSLPLNKVHRARKETKAITRGELVAMVINDEYRHIVN